MSLRGVGFYDEVGYFPANCYPAKMILTIRRTILVAIAGFVGFPLLGQTQYLDQIGVSALRAVTTNLNGAGIRVAQPEANGGDNGSTNSWQVNPANVGHPVALFTYISGLGSSTNYTNSVGTWSSHADAVAINCYGLSAGVATNVAHVDNYEVNYFLETYVQLASPPNPDAAVINQSYTFGSQSASVQQQLDTYFDNVASQYKTLFVSAACNASISARVAAPGTAYNCVSVGAYGGDSSIGPTIDNGRCKPDITAPGYPAGLTSFSTPYVSGAAAVLMQAGLRGDGGGDTNSAVDLRTLKALLLNGAVKPVNWTNLNTFPLDARYGAGVLNVFNSYRQMAGGKQASSTTNHVGLNADHPPVSVTNIVPANQAWDFAGIASGETNDAVIHYFLEVSNVTATVTLAWNRPFGQTNYSNPINDLDLYLYRCADSNLVARSDSYVNNVEHLYVTNLAAGRYDLQVVKYGGTNVVSEAETYALAWQFVPPPVLAAARAGTNALLTWPLYPAGFGVEARTNLLTGSAWNTNGLPASVITNGLNSIRLNTTNAARFFRLRQPNF
jgi:hypothetical protein